MTRPRPFDLGIQKNAQALQHMLKHPLVYRSSKPRLDTLQKHYVPKEKRVRLHLTACEPPLGTLRDRNGSHLGPSGAMLFPGAPSSPLPVIVTVEEVRPRKSEPVLTLCCLTSCQTQRIPIPPPRKTRAQLLDDILIRMRDTQNITEAPLGMAPTPVLSSQALRSSRLLRCWDKAEGLCRSRKSPLEHLPGLPACRWRN